MPSTSRFPAARFAALGAMMLVSGACSQTNGGSGSALQAAAPAAPEGRAARYCPQISLRDGTAILRKRAGDELEYIASITATNRDCRIVDGELRMKIGIAGRVVPGPASKGGTVSLPVRVAVVQGATVLYSAKGAESVSLTPGEAAGEFVYVDSAVAVPEPSEKNLVVFAGFDEGAGGGS